MAAQEQNKYSVPPAEHKPGSAVAAVEVIHPNDEFDTHVKKMLIAEDDPFALLGSMEPEQPMLLAATPDAVQHVYDHPGVPYPKVKRPAEGDRPAEPFVRTLPPENVIGSAFAYPERRVAYAEGETTALGEWHKRRMRRWKQPITVAIDDLRTLLSPGQTQQPRLGYVSYERMYEGKLTGLLPDTLLVGWSPRDMAPAQTNRGILPSPNTEQVLSYEAVDHATGTDLSAVHLGVEAHGKPNWYIPIGGRRLDALAYSIDRPHVEGLEPQHPVVRLDPRQDQREVSDVRAKILRATRMYDLQPDKTNRRPNPANPREHWATNPVSLLKRTFNQPGNEELINFMGQSNQDAIDRFGRTRIPGTSVDFNWLGMNMGTGLEGRAIIGLMEKTDDYLATLVDAMVSEEYVITCTMPIDGRLQQTELPLREFMACVRRANAEPTRLSDIAMYYAAHLNADTRAGSRVIRSTKNDAARIATPMVSVRTLANGMREQTTETIDHDSERTRQAQLAAKQEVLLMLEPDFAGVIDDMGEGAIDTAIAQMQERLRKPTGLAVVRAEQNQVVGTVLAKMEKAQSLLPPDQRMTKEEMIRVMQEHPEVFLDKVGQALTLQLLRGRLEMEDHVAAQAYAYARIEQPKTAVATLDRKPGDIVVPALTAMVHATQKEDMAKAIRGVRLIVRNTLGDTDAAHITDDMNLKTAVQTARDLLGQRVDQIPGLEADIKQAEQTLAHLSGKLEATQAELVVFQANQGRGIEALDNREIRGVVEQFLIAFRPDEAALLREQLRSNIEPGLGQELIDTMRAAVMAKGQIADAVRDIIFKPGSAHAELRPEATSTQALVAALKTAHQTFIAEARKRLIGKLKDQQNR